MSPVLILSRLCLNRRFQFLGISETSSSRTASTFLTVSSSMTRRSPARAAFSHGTITVMSLWRILMVRYSRSSPNILRIDDVVAALELDVLELWDVEVLHELRVSNFGNGHPPWGWGGGSLRLQ